MYKTNQEIFWKEEFGNDYINRNNNRELYKNKLNMFKKIFANINNNIESVIEFGSNIGLNLNAIEEILNNKKIYITALEINSNACQILKDYTNYNVINESILNYNDSRKYNFVLTCGFLIHLSPTILEQVYDILYNSSDKYICIIEYYNPYPISINYRGEKDKLFKRDFTGELMNRHKDLQLVDYGFIYHRDNDHPLDDLNWFLLEKNNN